MTVKPTQLTFSVLFWNVWVRSQFSPKRLALMRSRMDELIALHQPDAIGLNEVVADELGEHAPLLEHLEGMGYETFFAPFSPERNKRFSGSAFATRHNGATVQFREIGPDTSAARRGEPGHVIKLIQASVPFAGQQVNVVVNHLAHLVPHNWSTHVVHHKAFMQLMRAPELQLTTIIGGDFNQFKFMPRMWKAQELYHRATGTWLTPTWKLAGKIPIIQANYDNIFWTKCGKLQLEDFRVLPRFPSDHAPLLARFTVVQHS
jgi:endonuclease/exonuclease/phosphatase family metal-dependent hydrolase